LFVTLFIEDLSTEYTDKAYKFSGRARWVSLQMKIKERHNMKRRFDTGDIVITQKAYQTLVIRDVFVNLADYAKGIWHTVEPYGRDMNDVAVRKNKDRIMSTYTDARGREFWIVTKADRTKTTVMLPYEHDALDHSY